MQKIFVVSDGTGRTAEQVLKAALTQYPNALVETVMKQEVRTEQQIEDLMLEVKEEKGFILHTLVSQTLRDAMTRISRVHHVESMDLMGPLLFRLSSYLSNEPTQEPGLFFKLNEEYFKRIDSMQFAFNHDDGQRYYDYEKAELILVGVSRTFKTPLSIYFAFRGWFVGNYPVVLGVEPPKILSTLPQGRVFGLTTDPADLATLRRVRQHYLGGNAGAYSSMDQVRKELTYAEKIFAQHQWPVITVTSKPIEEIACEILAVKRRYA
jgi:[pyruvate, water dikinase]-phosphate phosphotransferase / [pyruvate, water dikinase] kinase